VVDDDRDTGDVLGELLREDGFNVCVAQEAGQAIEAAPKFRPEVVILDLVMPSTDGFTAAEQLQRLPSCEGTTYVAYSGLYTPEVLAKCKGSGIQHFILKPASIANIVDVLRNAMSQRAATTS
jgi:CheY-like chemotaxis protein